MSLQVQDGAAILGYQIHRSRAEANNQVSHGAIAMMFNILRELCGPDWQPMEVWSIHKEPSNIKPYQTFFGVRLLFNAEQSAIVFHSSWLMRTLPEVHSDIRLLVQKQIDALSVRHGDNLPEQVRSVLRTALLSGHASANQVAVLFSMHPRTLNRRLGDYGCGYQTLVDETRFEIAQQMLLESDLEISQLALMLHYADARSFIRAFRRWSGTTPARWRATQKQLHRVLAT